jgi:hypothetical protein
MAMNSTDLFATATFKREPDQALLLANCVSSSISISIWRMVGAVVFVGIIWLAFRNGAAATAQG